MCKMDILRAEREDEGLDEEEIAVLITEESPEGEAGEGAEERGAVTLEEPGVSLL